MSEELIPCLITEPKHTPRHAVIWLHGLGADGYDFEPIVPQLQLPEELGVRFVFPHAPVRPVTINNHYPMRAWYDIVSLSEEGRDDKQGIQQSQVLLQNLIAHQQQQGLSSEKIFLVGFSQGAAVALYTALRYPKKLGGVIALSGYLPIAGTLDAERTAANKKLPIFIAHGEEDPMVSIELGKYCCTFLEKLGYPVQWQQYPMAHTVCDQEIQDLASWLQKHMAEQKI